MNERLDGAQAGDPGMWRELDAQAEARFRAWARANFKAGGPISPLWHPVVRDECWAIERECEDDPSAQSMGDFS